MAHTVPRSLPVSFQMTYCVGVSSLESISEALPPYTEHTTATVGPSYTNEHV